MTNLEKHDRLSVERRAANAAPGEGPASTLGEIKTSDIARLLELFQVGVTFMGLISVYAHANIS